MHAVKGILGRKVGMTQVWDAEHRIIPVTVIETGSCRVVQLKTPERDGYAAVQLAYGSAKPARLTKAQIGHLEKGGIEPAKDLTELRVDDLSPYSVGQVIPPDVFQPGERVDVTGISKGKGFTGVMQRHNFKGQGASHGNHKKHRAPGSIGACATPARVFKGMGMPGQHGAQRVTTLNLEVVEGDAERGLLLIKGSVPGANGSLVFVRNAVKGGPAEFPAPRAAEPEPADEPVVEGETAEIVDEDVNAGADAEAAEAEAEDTPDTEEVSS